MRLTLAERIERLQSIGGSDAAAAVNLSPWKSPYKLWCEFMTDPRVPDEHADIEETNAEAKHFGNVLESVVAAEFMRRKQVRVQRMRRKLLHPLHSWMSAHIDRRIVGAQEGLECKTAAQFVAHHWGDVGDQIPIQYLIQVMHYLAVTGWQRWHVAVLIGGSDFRTFTIERDEAMIEDLIAREQEFWKCVVDKCPPDPVDLDDAYMRWPKDYGVPIVASPNARRAYDRLKEKRAQLKTLDAEIAADELIVKKWLGEHTTLLDVDGSTPLVTWKSQTTRRLDLHKARATYPGIDDVCGYDSPTRVFRYVEKKR